MVVMEASVSERRADRIIPTLGFTDHFHVPYVGFAGGLRVLWNSNIVYIEVLAYFTQAVHAMVNFNNTGEWIFSTTYASPNLVQKGIMWDSLRTISIHMYLPWLVVDDLNNVATSSEKLGGADFIFHRASTFSRRIEDCQLMDLGFKGTLFTWMGKRRGIALVQERLNHALTNDNWRLRSPEASVFHLPRVFFDHNPILIDLNCYAAPSFPRPFRFETPIIYVTCLISLLLLSSPGIAMCLVMFSKINDVCLLVLRDAASLLIILITL